MRKNHEEGEQRGDKVGRIRAALGKLAHDAQQQGQHGENPGHQVQHLGALLLIPVGVQHHQHYHPLADKQQHRLPEKQRLACESRRMGSKMTKEDKISLPLWRASISFITHSPFSCESHSITSSSTEVFSW